MIHEIDKENNSYPLLALRDVVVFPHMVIPLFVGREKSILALEDAMKSDKKIVLVSQLDSSVEDPSIDDLYSMGTLASILQLLRLPDGTLKVLVEGEKRVKLSNVDLNEYYSTSISEVESNACALKQSLIETLKNNFEQYVKINTKVPNEIIATIHEVDNDKLVDSIIAHLNLKQSEKQKLLEIESEAERAETILVNMASEMEVFEVENKIRSRVKSQMEKSQREYYLNEQMKAIQKELGDGEDGQNEIQDLEDRITAAKMSDEATKKARSELKKLKMMSLMSAEAAVIRNYIESLTNLPWGKKSKINKDIETAAKILNTDHYGLDEVKERVLEYLAVQTRTEKSKGAILCLVGPPGVGKTSLGKSIAKATNREFVRMALGGVKDEAEIRGHRRTYIGSMPGKIIQNITKTKVNNPLFMLDEIDKMSMDQRGDPASALLEVLDAEQNNKFGDHFLEVDYDLSNVMFIATANSLNLPAPLLDRMEIINLTGYTEQEKQKIAEKYLVPKQIKNNGLKKSEIDISPLVITEIIQSYTREAGVRKLEQVISKLCRKAVKKLLSERKKKTISINKKNLSEYLGPKKYSFGIADEKNEVGKVTGLAWTQVGGELLDIESVVVPGKGRQQFTGKLGDVMKESIAAALTVVRSRAEALNINPDFYQKLDVHVHVPEGATPKDGPSAGIGMCTALVSSLTDIPVKSSVAMTGEITLRGEVLAIGGLKEKILAAHRGGIKTIIIPKENEKDMHEIPKDVIGELEIFPVKWIDEVLSIALLEEPCKKMKKKSTKGEKVTKIPPTKKIKLSKVSSGTAAH